MSNSMMKHAGLSDAMTDSRSFNLRIRLWTLSGEILCQKNWADPASAHKRVGA